VHVVDALAITGDEGRGSLRKAAGSWQTSIDPQISEWGNPPLHRWLSMRALSSRLLATTKALQVKPGAELEGSFVVAVACDDKSTSSQTGR
jgi:hypothetical protein